MRIGEKLALFEEGSELDAMRIEPQELKSIQIRQDRFLGRCLFEMGISLASPVMAKTGRVFFGAYSYMNNGGYIRDNTFVGRYCSVGRRVTLGAAMHAMDGISTSPAVRMGTASSYTPQQRVDLKISEARGHATIVMNDVWIGDGAVILPGVTLGNGAVIGANAVVTTDIPPYAVVAGCPARILRYRFPQAIVEALMRSEWWELSKATLAGMPTGNVLEFIEETERARVEGVTHERNHTFHSYAIEVQAARKARPQPDI